MISTIVESTFTSKDELYIQDMKSIENEFQYADEQILQ